MCVWGGGGGGEGLEKMMNGYVIDFEMYFTMPYKNRQIGDYANDGGPGSV